MPRFREGSEDEGIWNAIYVANDYNLHGEWHGTVIDIGGHIGSFACFAVDKLKSRQVISVEPNWSNVQMLDENAASRHVIEPVWAAVAGVNGRRLRKAGESFPNTGGARYEPCEPHEQPEGPAMSITLDALLSTADYTPVLVKIDCEGAEYEILDAWKDTSKVGAVVGEWHAESEQDVEVRRKRLIEIFESRGFVVSVGPPHSKDALVGLFAAHKGSSE
jgi:FkbM family methyltransferase